MICWYCWWGWAEEVSDIYDKAVEELGWSDPLEFGPGHIVWSDENFEDHNIKWCLKKCVEDIEKYVERFGADAVKIVFQSLVDLMAIPEEVRCCCPADYDGKSPENFPPLFKTRRKKR